MSIVESGSPVSNGSSSPLSPDPLLDSTPLTLDFDPMSFQFKEFNSPTEEEAPVSPTEHERQTATLTLFDPFATISPDESDIAFEPVVNEKESHFNPLASVVHDEPDILTDQLGISSDGFIPQHFQNGGVVTDDGSKNVLSSVVHEPLEPDILINQTVFNTNNPDLVLIDTQESKETIKSDISTSDLVACATVNTNNTDLKPSVQECSVSPLTATCVESVFVQDDVTHADDFAVVNVLGHDRVTGTLEKAEVFVGEGCSSDSDCDSNSHKITSLRKKTSSVSSESSISENESFGKTTKQTVVRQSTVEKRIIVTNKQETQKESSYLTNGMESKDSLQNGQREYDSSSSSDEEERPPIECPISIKKLDGSDVVGGDDLNEMPELPKDKIVPVDLNSLRTQYVQQIEQEPSPSPYKEVISTGIDLQVLKTSYSQVAAEDSSLSSKEQITTGVNIRTLKNSLNKSQEGMENLNSALVEEMKPSVDRAQVTRKFSQDAHLFASRDDHDTRSTEEAKTLCRICNKHVYQMEKITAEKCVFHKDCFKCKECGKKLTVDTYSSHEKELFCKPHFKQLFQPKCQFGEDDVAPTDRSDGVDYDEGRQHKNEMVICENTPVDLPPDVVRCETKSNDLESLSTLNLLNLKSRFESQQDEPLFPNTSVSSLQRSPSLMARMAKYQSAVSGDHTNGDLSGGEDETDRDLTVACQEAKQTLVQNESVSLNSEVKAMSLKEKFEKGSVERDTEIEAERQERLRREKQEDLSCFGDSGTTEGARSLFRQMDAAASSGPRSPLLPLSPMKSSSVFHHQGPVVVADVVKCSQPSEKEEVQVEGVQVSEKFRFFENYQEPHKERKRFQATSPREVVKETTYDVDHRDPNIVRSSDAPDDELPATDTAKKMLNKFKALESQAENPVPIPVSAKTVKRIPQPKEPELRTVSPDIARQQDPDIVRCSYKAEEDTSMVEVDTAKSLRAKFENWTTEVVRENLKNEKQLEGNSGGEEEYLPQADMTKTLRAMFESIKETDSLKNSTEKAKPKVSKFIEQQQKMASIDICTACDKRIYPVEKLEASGMKLHKNCFRCEHCHCVLRFENYTTSGGKLFCVTHFKQLFISKGNYDEGFGREQHKEKWNRSRSSTPTPREECASSTSAFIEKTSEVAI